MKRSFTWIFIGCCLVSPGAFAVGALVTDRPSAEMPALPDYLPPEGTGGLQVPKRPDSETAPVTSGGPGFKLEGVMFEGNTALSDAQLSDAVRPYLGHVISVGMLEELRLILSRQYVDRGYINSGAIIPDQTIKDGRVRFRLVEGVLGDVNVSGTGDLESAYVGERLQLGTDVPLNDVQLQERFQLLLNDPLISRMDGRLGPGSAPGESVLDLAVTRAPRHHTSLSLDNYRPPSTGAEEVRFDTQVHNLTGKGDIFDLSLSVTEGGLGIDLRESVPLNARDLKLDFRLSASNTSVIEEPLEKVNIESKYANFEVGLSQPLINTLRRRFVLGARLALRWNRSTLLGEPFDFSEGSVDGESRVAVLRLYQEFVERSADQVFSARSTFNLGVDAFDATIHDGGSRPDGRFFGWLGQAQYAHRVMDNGAQVVLRGLLQLSDDALLPLERVAIGGVYTVRGYRENELVRDSGYAMSAEFHYPIGTPDGALPGRLDLIPFWDYGEAWFKGERDQKRKLHSVGLGLRWTPQQNFNAELFVAHAIEDIPERPEYDLQDDGIHFRVTALSD